MIRVVRTADAAIVAGLRRAWVEEDAGGPVDDPGFEQRVEDWFATLAGDRTALVAELDGAPVGMLTLAEFVRMPRPGAATSRWGYVANVFVLAAHRNRGIGGVLVEAVVAEARARHYVRLVLAPSERSVPFYRRAGFRDAGELLVLPLEHGPPDPVGDVS